VGFFKSEAEADAALSLRSLCRPHSTDLKPVKTELPTYPNAAREQNIRGQVAIQILVFPKQAMWRDPKSLAAIRSSETRR